LSLKGYFVFIFVLLFKSNVKYQRNEKTKSNTD
jgi:hypothetical protein